MADTNPFADLIPNNRVAGAFDDLVPTTEPKKKFGLEDTWPARIAKSIYSAVTLPGDAMQGKFAVQPEKPGWVTEGDISNQDAADRELVNRSMELAGLASPVSPAARMGVGFMGALKTQEAPAPSRQALESASDAAYKDARGTPFDMDSAAARDWAAKMQQDLTEAGKLKRFAPDTHSVLDDIQAAPEGSIVTGGNLISQRQALREASRNFTNPREKGAAEQVIRGFDNFVSGPPEESVLAGSAPAFAEKANSARRDYAALSRSEQIAEALRAADLTAGATHSGSNLDNATRQRFKSILLSDKNSSGYSPDEIAQMERIVKGSNVADGARYIGKLLGGGGGLGALHAAATGGTAGFAVGGPVGAAIGLTTPAVGYGAKKLADALTQREVQRLDEMVRRRSALGESTPETMVGSVDPRKAALARALLMGAAPDQ